MKTIALKAFFLIPISIGALYSAEERSTIDNLVDAIEAQDESQVEALIEALQKEGGSLKTANLHGDYPLHKASAGGNVAIITLLIKNGADPNTMDSRRMKPLEWAMSMDKPKAVEKLIEYGADFKSPDSEGSTALHKAVLLRNKAVAIMLIERGADINAADRWEETPLKILRDRDPELAIELEALYERVQAPLAKQLFDALEEEDKDKIKNALARGANVDARYEKGKTSLHKAIEKGNVEIVQLLIQHNANVNALSRNNSSPLHYAAFLGDPDIIDVLLDNGARTTAKDAAGMIPLHFASMWGNRDAVGRLIDRGNLNQVNSADPQGFNPLHYAVANRNDDIAETIAKLLIWYGAYLYSVNNEGKTPLDIAYEVHGDKFKRELHAYYERMREEREGQHPEYKLTTDQEIKEREEDPPSNLIPDLPAILELYTGASLDERVKQEKETKDAKE